jgi:hypothetical protein
LQTELASISSSLRYRESIEANWADHVGDGILMLAAFGSLRATLSLTASIGFRIIDLAYFPGSRALALEMNRGSDPTFGLSVLVVAVPLFLTTYWLLCRRLDDNWSLAHSRLHVIILGLFCLDTLFAAARSIPFFVYAILTGQSPEPHIAKLVVAIAAYGFLLGHFALQLRKAVYE